MLQKSKNSHQEFVEILFKVEKSYLSPGRALYVLGSVDWLGSWTVTDSNMMVPI